MQAQLQRLQRLPPIVVPLLLAVALLGYLKGSGHAERSSSAQSAPAALQVASGTGMLLEYPAGWQQRSSGSAIEDLPLEHPLFLAAGAGAGLEAGVLPDSSASPLPASLVGRLAGLPHVEVVSLTALQALHYTAVQLPGYSQQLELYAVPGTPGMETVLACHAPASEPALMSQCRRIAATLTLAGQSSADIMPEASYASRLRSVVGALDAARSAARARMAATQEPAELARLSEALAGSFQLAAKTLAGLEPPQVAGTAQVALASAMTSTGDAYSQLAQAARLENVGAYTGARNEVTAAEQGLNGALENYALLGYGNA